MPNKSAPCLESEMQSQVAEYFKSRKFRPTNFTGYHYDLIIPKIYQEIQVRAIGRISDIIIKIGENKLINIECKMTNYGEVIRQAKDHLKWADYSYVCFFADTYLPSYIIQDILSMGIGLLLWKPEIFTEVIQSSYNKNKDKVIRQNVLNTLKQKDSEQTAILENQLQQKII